jgi:hypothetical protein
MESVTIASEYIDFIYKYRGNSSYKISVTLDITDSGITSKKRCITLEADDGMPHHYSTFTATTMEDKMAILADFFSCFKMNRVYTCPIKTKNNPSFYCYPESAMDKAALAKCDLMNEFYFRCMEVTDKPEEFLPILLELIDDATPLIKNARTVAP